MPHSITKNEAQETILFKSYTCDYGTAEHVAMDKAYEGDDSVNTL